MGLQKNPRDAAFNRLAMYNYTDLKRYDEAMKAADAFFKESDKADFSYLDYMYFGHLLNAVKSMIKRWMLICRQSHSIRVKQICGVKSLLLMN